MVVFLMDQISYTKGRILKPILKQKLLERLTRKRGEKRGGRDGGRERERNINQMIKFSREKSD